MKKHIPVILIWLWLTMGLLALFISQTRPFNFLAPNSLILFIEESKLFFIIIAFPLMAGALSSSQEPRPSFYPYFLNGLKPFIIIILLSLPLTILTLSLSQANIWPLLRINLELLLITVFSILLCFRLHKNNLLVYYLVLFLLFGVGPMLYYLVMEFTEQTWSILILINPFWLSWNMNNPGVFSAIGGNQTWLAQCLIWVTLSIAVFLINKKYLKEPA